MNEIRPLELNDCHAVAEAHINYLRTPFCGDAGVQILKIRYEAIANQKGGIGFVAMDNGKFAGFVCGIWDREEIKKSLRKRWINLTIYWIKQSIQSPKMIPRLLHRLINRNTIGIVKLTGYELRPIVVLPEFRGRGIADQLTQRLLDDAMQRGYKEIFLFTEVDNVVAAKFYTKYGFKLEKETHMEGIVEKLFRYHFQSGDANN